MLDSETFYGTPSASIPDLSGIDIDNGRIRLLNIIGRGAWGVVYRGEETAKPGVYYAVKCLARRYMTYSQQRTIAKEVKMHAICSRNTRNVVQMLDVIEDDETGMMYIVTEFCDGGDLLEQIIAKEYVGNDEGIRDAFVQILDAVEACHNNHVYHRDLKPENILVKNGGKKFVVGDFGFATTKRITSDFRLGSEPFMSPEVRGGVHVHLHRFSSARADIWALGVILMNLLTGCLPWSKASVRDPHFVAYAVHDRDYLFHSFPISYGANQILKSIFTLNPRDRISIPTLRRRILALDTFVVGRKPKPALNVNTERYVEDDIDWDADAETDSDTLSDESERDIDAELEAATLHVVKDTVAGEADITDAARRDDIINTLPFPPEDSQVPGTAAPAVANDSLDVPIDIRVVSPDPVEADITDQIFHVDSDREANCVIIINAVSDDSDESDGPITPETHAVDHVAVAGTTALENIDDLAELDLGESGADSVLRAVNAAADQVKAEAEGRKGPVAPVPLDPGRNGGAAFAPPEQPKTIRRTGRRAKQPVNRFRIEVVDEYAASLERVRNMQRAYPT